MQKELQKAIDILDKVLLDIKEIKKLLGCTPTSK